MLTIRSSGAVSITDCSPVRIPVSERQVVCNGYVDELLGLLDHIGYGVEVSGPVFRAEDIWRALPQDDNRYLKSVESRELRSSCQCQDYIMWMQSIIVIVVIIITTPLGAYLCHSLSKSKIMMSKEVISIQTAALPSLYWYLSRTDPVSVLFIS